MKMVHPFALSCYDIDALLHKVSKLSTFVRRLSAQANEHPDWIKPSDYAGDGFEAFVETLLKMSPIDKRFCIEDVKPILTNDMGIDFEGIDFTGNIHTIQAKFRSDSSYRLTTKNDQISNFSSHSVFKHAEKPGGKVVIPRMTIITTCAGISYSVDDNMYFKKVRCIAYKDLKDVVDGETPFWRIFREQLEQRVIDG